MSDLINIRSRHNFYEISCSFYSMLTNGYRAELPAIPAATAGTRGISRQGKASSGNPSFTAGITLGQITPGPPSGVLC
ncbi:hypothetical protein [Desulfotomaculum defluvii]